MPQKTTHKIAFVADPLASFDPYAETTSFIIDEVNKRGWEAYHLELKGLFLKNSRPHAIANRVVVKKVKKRFRYKVVDSRTCELATMDAVFLRKDPPVDLNYIDQLSILELTPKTTLLINDPTWIKHANEKLFTLHFAGLMPETIVTQSQELIVDFVKKQKSAVLKPLNMAGGKGVIWVNAKNPSLNSIIEVLTHNQTRYIMAQAYIKEAPRGDKRILLLDGEYLGAFTRIPTSGDFRGNLHSGARLKKATLTKRDKEIIAQIAPRLRELKLTFVGIDIIGNYVTEINTTSPMGIREINQLENSQIEKALVDWLAAKLKER